MRCILLVFLFLFVCLSGNAQTYTGTGGTIPDNGSTPIDFPVTVSGLSPATLNATHGLVSVCINITHSWVSDLQISLIAPDGTQVMLINGIGGDGDNFTNTCLYQAASMSVAGGQAPFTGTWKPMGNLGYFNNGQNGNGQWQLHILDTYPADQGTLLSWNLSFGSNAPVAQPFSSSNLPIVVINTSGASIPDDPKVTTDMGIIYNGPGAMNHLSDPFNNYNGKIGIETRGSSSQMFPKKSFGLETRTAAGQDTSVPLLQMPKESDWVLSASYSDKSLMNNVLAYKLYRDFGGYAPATRYVELVLNGQYQGVYVLMEKIKRDSARVDISRLTDNDTAGSALTGGYILKIDKQTGSGGGGFLSGYAPLVSSGGQTIFYQFEYPADDEIHPKQAQYIERFVDSFEYSLKYLSLYDTTSGWRHYADAASFVRYFILNELSKNVDGYRISTYLYKTKDTKGNKLYIGPPWDYDIAFANADYCGGNRDTGWAFRFGWECANDYWQVPFWWERYLQDTVFRNELQCTWQQLRNTVLDTTNLFGWIDSTADYLDTAQARNFEAWPVLGLYVWPNPAPVPATYAGEVAELKSWLRRRITWLDTHIPGTCQPPVTGIAGATSAADLAVFPNPFSNQMWLQIPEAGRYTVSLSGMDGRKLYSEAIEAGMPGKYELSNLPELSPGYYLVRIGSGKQVVTHKLLHR